jgi:hypothetical protein
MSKKNESSEVKSETNVVEAQVVEATADVKDVKKDEAADETSTKRGTVVDTLFDLGIQWATTGLKLAKTALEETSKALANTAKTLETLAESLSPKKSA